MPMTAVLKPERQKDKDRNVRKSGVTRSLFEE